MMAPAAPHAARILITLGFDDGGGGAGMRTSKNRVEILSLNTPQPGAGSSEGNETFLLKAFDGFAVGIN